MRVVDVRWCGWHLQLPGLDHVQELSRWRKALSIGGANFGSATIALVVVAGRPKAHSLAFNVGLHILVATWRRRVAPAPFESEKELEIAMAHPRDAEGGVDAYLGKCHACLPGRTDPWDGVCDSRAIGASSELMRVVRQGGLLGTLLRHDKRLLQKVAANVGCSNFP